MMKGIPQGSSGGVYLRGLRVVAILSACTFLAAALRAQETNRPLTPPPEHDVHRVTTDAPPPEPPPALPPEQIIEHFSQREQDYLQARPRFGYTKTIRLTEYGLDGKPSGEYQLVTQTEVDSDGQVFEKVVQNPASTLRYMQLEPPDLNALMRIPAYPLTPSQLPKYDLKYVGREKVDEVDCYIFEAKPKTVERAHPYFQGVVWVDTQYLEVVKTYGSFVTDLGPYHPPSLPFSSFETYRENVQGKYWFPDYLRSDDYLHLKNHDVPVRLVIKWTDFKPLPAAPQPSPAAAPSAPSKP